MPSQQDYSNVKNYTTEYVSGVSDAESTSQTLKSDIKIVFLFMFLLVIVGWILVPVTSAEANGKSFPIFSGTEGPYKIQVRISPSTPKVGKLHVVLVLEYLETREPVDSAVVNITAVGPPPDKIELDSSKLYAQDSESNWHEADLLIPYAGKWELNAEINHGTKVTSVGIPIVVESWDVDTEILVLIASSLPLLVTIAWYFRRKYSNK